MANRPSVNLEKRKANSDDGYFPRGCYAGGKGRAAMQIKSSVSSQVFSRGLVATWCGICFFWSHAAIAQAPLEAFLNRYCVECHRDPQNSSGIVLPDTNEGRLAEASDQWERVVRKLTTRQMPPEEAERPAEADYDAIVRLLTAELDRDASMHPQPGRTETLRRLNRAEYRNAIRDLLAINVDVESLLPADESSGGFDNVTVTDLSPTLLNRYLTAAQKISRLAVGGPVGSPQGDTFRVPADQTQEEQVVGLPLGTRGGTLIDYTFPRSGEYEVQIRLARDRNEEVEGLRDRHQLQVLLDRAVVSEFEVKPPKDGNHSQVDAHLVARISTTAGPHKLGVTFIKKSEPLLETKREPYAAHFNMHRHPRLTPAVFQVSIAGPISTASQALSTTQTAKATEQANEQPTAPESDTPSRKKIFIAKPNGPDDELDCAQQILTILLRLAYRRPIVPEDLEQPLKFFNEARQAVDATVSKSSMDRFEAGIEAAISSILVNPHFFLRIERDPENVAPQTAYRISDIELASRLSFFLWSSLPDEELLSVAERGELSEPKMLEQQTRRMLADPRASNLIENFAAQWLYLRNLDSITPDLRLFPDFDDNLRQAFRRETELLLESIMREDYSVTKLLDADYTYLNERLAKHYGIPNIYGSRFRRVALDATSNRGGLLRHGSILTVTSYATRTSPVIRGHWILKNIIGAPPAPPPPDVPALKENTVNAALPIRERLAEHRAQAACASCHNLMDPIGFSLENFDAVGRWRETELGQPIDTTGEMLGGQRFESIDDMEQILLSRPELLASTLSEKLLMFALGRSLDAADAPAIRKIVQQAREHDFRFSSIVVGITHSTPFLMRTSE